ncbi:hypothetical protein A3D69_00985 [Candidatus Uhrbacteria bacterium RIFCSPHIGHO2_02_FULL_54_11]|nr:MAG: hypothetical protein A3D69_00985 [Candidatus Uhrbacteria bacterium RIFCSPHIGHO2_02_FULL_54_11]
MVLLESMTERGSIISSFQPSLSEWLRAIGHADAEALQVEDVGKRDRLEVLRQIIGINYDRVTSFPAADFYARIRQVADFISEHGEDLCALRLVPYDPTQPKFRTRGRSLNDSLGWLDEQGDIDPTKYRVEVVEHSDMARWSTIFIVREDGIFGTIVDGLHFQLTQGNTEEGNVSRAFFRTPDGVWQWSEEDSEVQAHMEEILKTIRVTDPEVRARLCDELDSEFTSEGFLVGYFETLLWPTKLIFIDYNRQLHKMSEPPCAVMEKRKGRDTSLCSDGATDGQEETRVIVKGIQAGTGEVEGVVRIVTDDALDEIEFNQGDILVTDNTDVRFLPLMRKAGAVVTNRGGMLSHAAIIARELGVPCVVGCGDATHKFVEGQVVQVDATRGLILSLSPPPGAGEPL